MEVMNTLPAQRRGRKERLVNQEHPWLWAVRNEWYFNDDTQLMLLRRPDAILRNAMQGNDAQLEVWARFDNLSETYPHSETIQARLDAHGTSWADAVLDNYLGYGVMMAVTRLALIERYEFRPSSASNLKASPGIYERLIIYRPRGKEVGLDSFLARLCEE